MLKPTDQEVREIEVTIEEAQAAIKLRDTLLRLKSNPDFIAIVQEAYTTEFAHNLVMQRGIPSLRNNPTMIDANTRKLDSIAELAAFLRSIEAKAAHFEALIKQGTDMLNDVDEDEGE